jgi:deoxyadenosine/deoxycytidine kinase
MPIICLEGASGIGKSTAAKYMADKFGYVRVPEVNELFERPANELPHWYFQMQEERWKMASEISDSGRVAILDGDHLHPIWYNWIFSDLGFQPINEVMRYFKKSFTDGKINFPDAYVVLKLPKDELRLRKESDKSRSRKNFETHLRLIEPQIEYFEALTRGGFNEIKFLESTSTADIAGVCKTIAETSTRSNSEIEFNVIENFIASKVTSA